MMDLVAFSKRLYQRRIMRRMSQEQVAKAANISVQFYSNLERGIRSPSMDCFLSLANALSVDANALLREQLVVFNRPTDADGHPRMFFCQPVAEIDYSKPADEEQADGSNQPDPEGSCK